MVFYRVESANQPASYLEKIISSKLEAGKKVLWLVPGGSAIPVAVRCSRLLDESRLENLCVMLTDERYGPPDHPDSNTRQLREMGFSLDGARILTVLDGSDIGQTTIKYANQLKTELSDADFKVGLFGIGADGHTAGIKPESPAVNAKELTASFTGEDFERITITPLAVSLLDEAVVYAVDDNKKPVLDALDREIDINIQPAQVLKRAGKLTVFNGYKGEVYESR